MNLYLMKWSRKPESVIWRKGGNTFVVLPGKEQKQISAFLTEFFTGNVQSVMMKDSKTTKAGISELVPSGKPVFWKRNNNKGLSFTLRYLFRPARVFRAAAAAECFQLLGIATPRVLAVGEKRILCYLKYGYLLTDSQSDICSVTDLFQQCSKDNVDRILSSFLAYSGRVTAILHKAGVIHGDLKISNFYYTGLWSDANYGIWDLDSVRQYGSEPDRKARTRELSRLVSSLLIQCDGNGNLDPSFFDPELLTQKLLAEYTAHFSGDQWVPDTVEVCKMARERWCREPGLIHVEKQTI